jgi:hypothetical protein
MIDIYCDSLDNDKKYICYMEHLKKIEKNINLYHTNNTNNSNKSYYLIDGKTLDSLNSKQIENQILKNQLNSISEHLDNILKTSILSDEQLYNLKKDQMEISNKINEINSNL